MVHDTDQDSGAFEGTVHSNFEKWNKRIIFCLLCKIKEAGTKLLVLEVKVARGPGSRPLDPPPAQWFSVPERRMQ